MHLLVLASLLTPACRRNLPNPARRREVFVDLATPLCGLQPPPAGVTAPILHHSDKMKAAGKPDWIVLTADNLAPVARQWAAYRTRQGHQAEVITVSEILGGRPLVADRFLLELRHRLVRDLGTAHPPGVVYLLLLGDSDDTDVRPEVRTDQVPTLSWNSEYLTDLPYADLDGDGLPDIALGRVPVRSCRQAETILRKTIRYEQAPARGPWKNRLLLFASQGGFGTVIDALMERAGLDLLSSLPAQWDVTFLHARPGSPYGLPPGLYTDKLVELLNQGQFLAVYTGHGYLDSLEDVDWGPQGKGPILDIPSLDRLDCQDHCPLVLLAACHTGDFGHGTSFAEAVLQTPDGPPAVVAATDVSHPYPNAMLAFKISRLLAKRDVGSLGHAFVESLLTLGQPETMAELRVDHLVDLVWSREELRDILDDNRRMYVLLGDPALRLPFSQATLQIGSEILDSGHVQVCGVIDEMTSGTVHLSILRPRLSLPQGLDTTTIPTTTQEALQRWQAANHRVLTTKDIQLTDGRFSTTLALPPWNERGRLVIRAQIMGWEDDASAAIVLETRAGNDRKQNDVEAGPVSRENR